MARLRVSLLGGFQVRLDSGPAVALPTRKAQALLAYLALPPGQAHPHKLAALLEELEGDGRLGRLALAPLPRADTETVVRSLAARCGKLEVARAHVNAALAEYRAMAMPYWLTRAEDAWKALA